MKKSSLMGASVVAAALLAAAPVVAPVASLATPGTQVVKAAVSSGTATVAQKISAMSTDTTIGAGANYGQLGDFSTQLSAIPYFSDFSDFGRSQHKFVLPAPANANEPTQPFHLVDSGDTHALQLNNYFPAGHEGAGNSLLKYFFNGQNQVNLISADNVAAAQNMYYTIRFEYSNAINSYSYWINTAADVTQVRRDLANNGGTVTMFMQLYDGEQQPITTNGLLKSTVSYNANVNRAAYVNYTDTLTAHVGDSANIYNLVNSFINANGQIRDYNGNDITTTAFNNNAISVTQLGARNQHPTNGDDGIVNGNFTRAGKYYQRVVINLRNVLGGQAARWTTDQWQDAVRGGLITVNGQTPDVNNSDANVFLTTNTVNTTTVDGHAYRAGQLILKRTVNVDVDQGAFKTDKINGKVTVNMNDGMAAQVYDENGKQVLGRALPNKSAWKTIEKRTYYKDGQVFYQVSTNEYVKAQDVVFTEYSSSSNSNSNDQLSGKVNVTKYPSKVINILNDSHAAGVYAINEDGQGMHQVIGRFLPAGSAWINQGTAEVNGNLFYQVSTNEWVSANSVAK
ncbi:SLAP domain-containing protein [Bombilactobacillus mellis]|uniref:SLAP domain-containing protein n=1 Tax=Bombilactobacillus mellis TaxID=1218508 RepID=UPI00158070F3|nr:SLAP domain-containing protein [Bombilactobacillus mellis]NUF25399.1 hypothetical protein [Bombilactobacillus mellis]